MRSWRNPAGASSGTNSSVAAPALPWVDGVAFARRAIEMALADRADADRHAGWVFFDRGLIDAAAVLQHRTGELALTELGRRHRYHRCVFSRRPGGRSTCPTRNGAIGFEDAVAEYERLIESYGGLGYDVVMLPKAGVAARADFVLGVLPARPSLRAKRHLTQAERAAAPFTARYRVTGCMAVLRRAFRACAGRGVFPLSLAILRH